MLSANRNLKPTLRILAARVLPDEFLRARSKQLQRGKVAVELLGHGVEQDSRLSHGVRHHREEQWQKEQNWAGQDFRIAEREAAGCMSRRFVRTTVIISFGSLAPTEMFWKKE